MEVKAKGDHRSFAGLRSHGKEDALEFYPGRCRGKSSPGNFWVEKNLNRPRRKAKVEAPKAPVAAKPAAPVAAPASPATRSGCARRDVCSTSSCCRCAKCACGKYRCAGCPVRSVAPAAAAPMAPAAPVAVTPAPTAAPSQTSPAPQAAPRPAGAQPQAPRPAGAPPPSSASCCFPARRSSDRCPCPGPTNSSGWTDPRSAARIPRQRVRHRARVNLRPQPPPVRPAASGPGAQAERPAAPGTAVRPPLPTPPRPTAYAVIVARSGFNSRRVATAGQGSQRPGGPRPGQPMRPLPPAQGRTFPRASLEEPADLVVLRTVRLSNAVDRCRPARVLARACPVVPGCCRRSRKNFRRRPSRESRSIRANRRNASVPWLTNAK